jgi:hypothetical protein
MKKTPPPKWFIKTRGSYLPNSWQGWLTYIPYAAYLVGPLILVLHNQDDFWTALFIVIPNWIAAVAIMQWIAVRKS